MSPCRVCARALSWPASAAGAAVVLASVVSAQEPTPELPSDPPADAAPATPDEDAPDSEGAALGAPARWHYGLGVGILYDSNLAFRLGEGPGTWSVVPRGNVARTFTRQRGSVRVFARGTWHGYRRQDALNRFNAAVGFNGGHRPSPNTRWQANASYELGYSDSSQALSDQGVLLPLVGTREVEAGVGWRRTWAGRTSLLLRGRFSRVDFDQDDPLGRSLAEGQNVRGSVSLRRELGSGDSGSLRYSLGATLARQPPASVVGGRPYYLTHFLSLQWSHVLSGKSSFELEGGASYTPEEEEAGLQRRGSFFGGVSYRRQVERAHLTLSARREVTPAYGLGVSRVQTRFHVFGTRDLGRAWSFNMRGSYSILETPEDAPVAYGRPLEVSASLSRGLGRHFAVSTEGRYRRRGSEGGLPAVQGYQVGLFLSLKGP